MLKGYYHTMKKVLKAIAIVLGVIFLLLMIGIAFFSYEFNFKKVEISQSIEGIYTVTMYQVGEPGWPFGPVSGEFVLRKEDEKINTYSFSVSNDGGSLTSGNAVFQWKDDCVKIRVCGEEQEDMLYTLGFDGTSDSEKAGPWFTDEEVVALVKETYGEQVSLLEKDEYGYCFRMQTSQLQEGTFDFYVEQDERELRDNYLYAFFRFVSGEFFDKHHISVDWQEKGVGAATRYIPSFQFYSSYEQELISFCEKICDYIEYCMGVEQLSEEKQLFQVMHMIVAGKYLVFQPTVSMEDYDRTQMYNELYTQIDETLHAPVMDTENSSVGMREDIEISLEMLDYYLSLEPGCSFLTDDGMEYRMIAVDRALGSNFYVLLGTKDGGETCVFVNPDPYNGSGGEAKWITFVNDELGFSCLSHAAGAYGSLYRTEDGGDSWVEIKYPSAKAQFSDGTFYNPFVMPEKVYKKDGILYMEVGQGADGDYYDEKGFCHGLYQSTDDGLNWEYVQNISP